MSASSRRWTAASTQEQLCTGSRTFLALFFGRRRPVAEHHRALRLHREHAEQHARGGIRSIDLEPSPLLPRLGFVRSQLASAFFVGVIALWKNVCEISGNFSLSASKTR